MHRPNALHAGLSVFTTVPVRPIELYRHTARGAILALPWVGLLLGGLAATAAWLVLVLRGGDLMAAIAGLTVLALATGALHLDGLADTADGLGSRKPADEALAVMAKSDIGPMGVAALVLVLLLEVGALSAPRLDGLTLPLLLVAMPLVGRVSALVGSLAPPARAGGLGALFSRAASPAAIAIDVVFLAPVIGGIGYLTGGALGLLLVSLSAVAAWGVGWAWHYHLVRRLGGLTGDTLGFLIEVSQLTFVVAAALSLSATA